MGNLLGLFIDLGDSFGCCGYFGNGGCSVRV